MTRRKIELLAPAGDMEKLKTVFHYGADAVYLGGKAFNLRAASHNFSIDELSEAVNYAHALGKRVYVTLNILAHNREITALPKFVQHLEAAGIDAVIVADLGVLSIVQEHSNLPIHISTQASSTNWRAVKVWHQLGAKRVVLARECSIKEIREIKDKVPELELEVFVHGAMCMAYSGRCMISQYMTERDGNRGACANACRWKYSVVEEQRPGQYFPVYEDDTGSYLYNSKDLCTIEFLQELLDAGVDGLKIEGRMKTLFYGGSVTRIYRQALDSYLGGQYQYEPRWLEALKAVSNRGYTSGFFFGKLDRKAQNLEGGYERTKELVGVVRDQGADGRYLVEIRGRRIEPGTRIQVIPRWGAECDQILTDMENADTGKAIEAAHPGIKAWVRLDGEVAIGDLIQRDVTEMDPTVHLKTRASESAAAAYVPEPDQNLELGHV